MRRRAIVVLLAACSLAGCGDARDGGRESGPKPRAAAPADEVKLADYPGYPELDPAGVARAYVEALDRRDGRRWCRLAAPYISGHVELMTRDPDSFFARVGGCDKFVALYIGYVEDCCPPEFVHARVLELDPPRRQGGLTRIDARIALDTKTQGRPKRETLKDVIWLAQLDGAWRVAKPSAVAHAASLGGVAYDYQQEPADWLAPPDVQREQRRYAAELRDFERRMRERARAYRPVGEPADCDGGARITDPENDLSAQPSGRPDAPLPRTPRVDIRAFTLSVSGDRTICAAFETHGDIVPPLFAQLSFKDVRGAAGEPGPGFLQQFTVELREDGRARIVSGEDDDDRPLAVPGEVGVAGDRLTVELTPESFAKGSPGAASTREPPFDEFGFDAALSVLPSKRQSLRDDLGGDGPFGYYRHPGGQPIPQGP